MWGDIMNFYKLYIKEHFFVFCLALGILVSCVLLGMFTAFTANADSLTEVDSYIQSIIGTKKSYFSVLKNGITNNFRCTLTLCVASAFVLLLPCTFLVIAFKGFSTGFAASFIIRLYALKGVAATITAVVLPLFFSLPVYFVMYISCVDFPLQTFKLRKEISSSARWKMYVSHLIKMLVLFMALNFITSIEAFFSQKLFNVLVK